jgi:DNA polymerase-3 subunit gamma/tau
MAVLNSVNNDGLDLRQFNRELVEYLRSLLLVKTGAVEAVDLTPEDLNELKELAAGASLHLVLNAVKLFGQVELGNDDSSSLPLELALVDCYLASGSMPAAPDPVKAPAARVSPPRVKTPAAPPEITASPASPLPAAAAEAPAGPEPAVAAPFIQNAPAEAPSLSSEIERLKLNWKQVIDGAGPNYKKTTASALLKSGSKPLSIEGDTVVLSFGFKIHKENIEKPENKLIAEKIISEYLGHPYKIQCVLDPKKDHLVNLAKKMGAQVISMEEK